MTKLIVRTPQDAVEIIDIGEGGGYFDETRVLWDERTQGPIPPEMHAKVVAEMAVRTAEIEKQESSRRNEEKLNEEVRKAAKARIKDFDMSKVKDADVRALLADMKTFVLKFQ